MFKVSVIIPVYNAANYVRNAVESAINLDEVGEVIIIEDKSPDNALEVCEALEKEYFKVRLFQHPNGENRGPGASRNLGIEKAQYDYIAFLDADDWYLPNRFKAENELFQKEKVDGVYGGNSNFFVKNKVLKKDSSNISIKLKPEELFYHLIKYTYGHFHTNTITLKKSIFNEIGGFDTDLWLHQDSFMWHKAAFHYNLYSGFIYESVAVRRVHENNRIKKRNINSAKKIHKKELLYYWDLLNNDRELRKVFLMKYLKTLSKSRVIRWTKIAFFLLINPKYILVLFSNK